MIKTTTTHYAQVACTRKQFDIFCNDSRKHHLITEWRFESLSSDVYPDYDYYTDKGALCTPSFADRKTAKELNEYLVQYFIDNK